MISMMLGCSHIITTFWDGINDNMRYSALHSNYHFSLRDFMFDANLTPIRSAAECDIEAMFDAVMIDVDHPQNLFDQMLQSFARKLETPETPKQAIEEVLIFSARLTEYLESIEFEINYL